MEVSKQLKKQMVIEILVLIFLIFVIVYAMFAIKKSNDNKVTSVDGMVVVLDDSKYKGLEIQSDGEGLESDGITYTITNNNAEEAKYKIVLTPNVHDSEVLDLVRVSIDDIYTYDLTKLERDNGGYVLTSFNLKPGYTKIHVIKYWYKKNSDEKLIDKNLKFEYKLVKEKTQE